MPEPLWALGMSLAIDFVCVRSSGTVTTAHSYITHIFPEGLKHVVVVHVVSMRANFKKGCISSLLQVCIQQSHCDDSKVLGCSFPVFKNHSSLR